MSILADAMTPDKPISQPRKRAWKRLALVLACVVAVVTIVLLATPPKPEPVKVWFVRATNELGEKKLLFEGTNGTTKEIEVFAGVVTGAVHQTATSAHSDMFYSSTNPTVAAGRRFYFALSAAGKDVPYHVEWESHAMVSSASVSGRLRWACHNLLNAHGEPGLAVRLITSVEEHTIPSTEIKE